MRALVFLVLMTACGGDDPPIGDTCGSGADCDPAVSCVAKWHYAGSPGCSTVRNTGMVCSLECLQDSECASLGADVHCVVEPAAASCGAKGYCAR